MHRLIALLLAVVLLNACAPEEEKPTTWRSESIIGKVITLVDEKKFEEYRFSQEKYVAAAFGIKDGAIAAPLLYWKLEGEKLIISESEGFDGNIEELTALSKRGKLIKVRRKSGEIAEYKITAK